MLCEYYDEQQYALKGLSNLKPFEKCRTNYSEDTEFLKVTCIERPAFTK